MLTLLGLSVTTEISGQNEDVIAEEVKDLERDLERDLQPEDIQVLDSLFDPISFSWMQTAETPVTVRNEDSPKNMCSKEVQWHQNLVVIRAVRAKGTLTHELHQLVAGFCPGPLHVDMYQNLSPPWKPSVSDSSPPPQKVGHQWS
ncbi:hypothetical protein CB1_000301030 [Camelus ferus]|nr:hypothetical protein CB1_000301030 [Camelus ferus]